MNFRTVLFDLDGTIIDSNELINVSFEYTFKQYNFNFSKEEILEFNGPTLQQTFQKINPGHVDAMIQTYREFNLANHTKYVKLFPHVIETLDQLKNNNINIGIVTSKMRNAVSLGMELTGLTPYFETIITIDDVTHAKPHPEAVIKAMNQVGGEVTSTLMVGDNYHDIVAGQNAGIKTAGVAWSQKGEDLLATYQPTYMLQDMKDLLEIVGV